MQPRELLIKKLIYQSDKRGCKETDIILGNFSSKYLHKMNDANLLDYKYFLSQLDSDIWDWVNCRTAPQDERCQRIITMIKSVI
jgi:antitoxin CptB